MAWSQEEIERLTAAIPHLPGVYIMRDRSGRVLYVGKAVDLANRVMQYFRGGDSRPFVSILHSVLKVIDTIVTTNEKEALLLENELIKKHRPPFNIVLRDDKSYLYLKIDLNAPVPKLEMVRRRVKDKAFYFGPYHSSSSIRHTFDLINRYFGLRTCSDIQLRNRKRPCLEYQLGRCLGPCTGLGKDAYRERVEAAVLFLQGRYEEVKRRLVERMKTAAETENFEEAARLRDQLRAIETSMAPQAVILPLLEDADAIGFVREGDVAAFAVLRFESGRLSDKVPFVLENTGAPDDELLESFVMQYYGRASVPRKVFLPHGVIQELTALREALMTRFLDKELLIYAPSRGPAADAVKLANQNARQLVREALVSTECRTRALTRIAELLGLDRLPRVIEGYDFSNLFSSEPVGVKVVFEDGKPSKRGYRTFAIRTEGGDVQFVREVIRRRFLDRSEIPDVILIDGGEQQLRAAVSALKESDIDVPVVALAKSRVIRKGSFGPAEHSPERLFVLDAHTPDSPVRMLLPLQHDVGLHLLMRVRDEAHRFAISFHRRRRIKKETVSVLDGIKGLGKKRRVILLRHFGSVASIKAASLEELKAVPQIPPFVAERLFLKVHGES